MIILPNKCYESNRFINLFKQKDFEILHCSLEQVFRQIGLKHCNTLVVEVWFHYKFKSKSNHFIVLKTLQKLYVYMDEQNVFNVKKQNNGPVNNNIC